MSKGKCALDEIDWDDNDSDESEDLPYEPGAEESDDFDDVDMDEVDKVIASYQASSTQAEPSTPRNDPSSNVDASERVQGQQEGSFEEVLRGLEQSVDEDGYNTEEFRSLQGSDDEDKGLPEFQVAEYGHVRLDLGMTFPTMKVFKEAIKDYNIALGRVVKFKKNEPLRCRVVCAANGCHWAIYASWAEPLGAFQVKTFNGQHDCCRELENPLADRHWVGNKLVELMRTNPRMNLSDAKKFMCQKYQVQLIDMKIYRAMRIAKKVVEGSEKEQYARLRDYFQELDRSNQGSTVGISVERVDLSQPARFGQLYICFQACKVAVMSSCRPLIGLDGCFLKGYYGGTLLAAVTQDGNNSFYVIAYAVVEQETKDTWSWFLTRLFEDIGSPREHGWEFISDMQKGLIPAMQELCPGARHRFCVKHLEANVWKQWKSIELRLKLWSCAKSKTMPEFQRNFQELKVLNEDAWLYLSKFDPATWSRAGFSTLSKNQSLLNNMCEQFNATIVKYRGEPIITMLENIRTYLVTKMSNLRKKIENYPGPITPSAQSKLELAKKDNNVWLPMWAGDEAKSLFQVQHVMRPDKHVVNLEEKTCSCREWDLCGIPCPHACCCIGYKGGKPESYVHSYLTKEMWEKTYRPFIHPVRGQDQWESSDLEPIFPPTFGKGPGRPKKKRTKTNDVPQNSYKAKRVQRALRCGRCGNSGHNSRNCKGTVQKKQEGPSTGVVREQQVQHGSQNSTIITSSRQEDQPPGPSTDVVREQQVQHGSQNSTIVTSSRQEDQPPLFIPTPRANTQPRPWTYGYGIAPSMSLLLPDNPSPVHHGFMFNNTYTAVRAPPRRPQGSTPPNPAPLGFTAAFAPTTTVASRSAATTSVWTSTVGAAASATQGTTAASAATTVIPTSAETLQRASRITRSVATMLGVSTQVSTAPSNPKPTTSNHKPKKKSSRK